MLLCNIGRIYIVLRCGLKRGKMVFTSVMLLHSDGSASAVLMCSLCFVAVSYAAVTTPSMLVPCRNRAGITASDQHVVIVDAL